MQAPVVENQEISDRNMGTYRETSKGTRTPRVAWQQSGEELTGNGRSRTYKHAKCQPA